MAKARSGRRRFAPLVWLASAVAAVLLILGVSGTLSTWTQAIVTNQDNQAGSGDAVILTETGPGAAGGTSPTTCASSSDATNSYTCTTINKYGNGAQYGTAPTDGAFNLVPGGSTTTTVTLENTGGANASTLTFQPGTCASTYKAGGAATPGLCDYLNVTVACGPPPAGAPTLSVGPVLASDAGYQASHSFSAGLNAGQSTTCAVTVALLATAPPTVAAQLATQTIVWTLTA